MTKVTYIVYLRISQATLTSRRISCHFVYISSVFQSGVLFLSIQMSIINLNHFLQGQDDVFMGANILVMS